MTNPAKTSNGKSNGAGLRGVNASAVIEAIKARHSRRKSGQNGPDGRKLALVMEGGAMRATGPAGGVIALQDMGLVDIFDEAYATSAGAINASYFLSGQGSLGITIYFEDLTTGRFINFLRPWKVVDLDYVFDEIVSLKKPLDMRRLLESPTRLFVTVMDSATGEATVIDTKATRTPVIDVVKAALAMPVLYNKTVEVENKQCMDGGFRIPFPLQQAIDNGCTDILILLSRSEDFCTPAPSRLTRILFDMICARGRPGLNQTYARNHIYCRAARDLAFGRTPASRPGVNIAVICLEESERVQQLTVNPRLLRAAAISYGRRTLGAFGVDGKDWNLGPALSVPWANG